MCVCVCVCVCVCLCVCACVRVCVCVFGVFSELWECDLKAFGEPHRVQSEFHMSPPSHTQNIQHVPMPKYMAC